jgi:hypothetical protein
MQRLKSAGYAGMLSAALMVSASCGSDGDGGGSGLPSDGIAKDLPEEDARALCMWLEDTVNGFQPSNTQLCTASIALQTMSEAECDAAVPDCVEFLDMSQTEPDDFECETAMQEELGDCTATVGEIEACYRAAIDVQKKFVADTSCADAGKATQPMVPASCAALETKCPDLAIDTEEEAP